MSGILATTSTTTSIIEETLLPFHSIKTQMFATIDDACTRMLPIFEEHLKNLGAFGTEVNARGSRLQNQQGAVPPLKELVMLREGFVRGYWDYKNIFQKTVQMATELENAINYLKLPVYTNESDLLKNAPELLKQIKASDAIAQVNIKKLSEHLGMVQSIRNKTQAVFTSSVDWSVQRYVQIVQNLGQPLWGITRLMNNTSYHIPTMLELEEQDNALKLANKDAFKTESNSEVEKLLTSNIFSPSTIIVGQPSSTVITLEPLPAGVSGDASAPLDQGTTTTTSDLQSSKVGLAAATLASETPDDSTKPTSSEVPEEGTLEQSAQVLNASQTGT